MTKNFHKTKTIPVLTAFLFATLFLFASAHGPVAEEATSGPTGILPDSPLFGLDRFFEGVGDMFAFGADKKFARQIEHMKERVSEVGFVVDRGRYPHAQKALDSYKKHLEKATGLLEKIEDKDTAVGQLATNVMEHREVLAEFTQEIGDGDVVDRMAEFINEMNTYHERAMGHASEARRRQLNEVKELFDVEVEDLLSEVLEEDDGHMMEEDDEHMMEEDGHEHAPGTPEDHMHEDDRMME